MTQPSVIDAKIEQLDGLGAILPLDRATQLASLLSDDDIETLRHLAKAGMGENSLRALMSDLGYLEGWALAAIGTPLPWPAPQDLILKFIAHHLWDASATSAEVPVVTVAAETETSSAATSTASAEAKAVARPVRAHGMPRDVAETLRDQGLLRSKGPHAPATVERRLAHWSTLHRWRGLDGPFGSTQIRAAMRLAVRVADRPRGRKSQKAITLDVLEQLLATCETAAMAPMGHLRDPHNKLVQQSSLDPGPLNPLVRLVDVRDRAILLVGFASGGRRRSELTSMRYSQLTLEQPLLADPHDADSPLLPSASLLLGRTKTENSGDDNAVLLIGRPVDALTQWLEMAKISDGPLFRAIDRWGNLKTRGLSPQSVNNIIKQRCALAGLNPDDYSAHGLRSGFLTEAANQGIPLQDAMQQSRHRSLTQASRYYNEANRSKRRSARIVG